MRIAIYGGTFDPIHIGHIKAIGYAIENLVFDQIRIIVAGNPPQKDAPLVDSQTRYRWVVESIKQYYPNQQNIIVDDREINRSGINYSIDTVREIRQQFPESEIIFIIGDDLESKVSTWKDSKELLEMVELFVVPRNIFPASSSGIKQLIYQKASLSGLLSKEIEDEIYDKSLYNVGKL